MYAHGFSVLGFYRKVLRGIAIHAESRVFLGQVITSGVKRPMQVRKEYDTPSLEL